MSIVYDISHVKPAYREGKDKLVSDNIKPILRDIKLKKLLN
jgi:hypothetical protein